MFGEEYRAKEVHFAIMFVCCDHELSDRCMNVVRIDVLLRNELICGLFKLCGWDGCVDGQQVCMGVCLCLFLRLCARLHESINADDRVHACLFLLP